VLWLARVATLTAGSPQAPDISHLDYLAGMSWICDERVATLGDDAKALRECQHVACPPAGFAGMAPGGIE
jgi:hypothetical protein